MDLKQLKLEEGKCSLKKKIIFFKREAMLTKLSGVLVQNFPSLDMDIFIEVTNAKGGLVNFMVLYCCLNMNIQKYSMDMDIGTQVYMIYLNSICVSKQYLNTQDYVW